MKWSWKIGRLAGINVYMHATFLLIILFVLFVNYSNGSSLAASARDVAIVLIIFGCIVLHELGHALTARKFGVRTQDIILLPIGGVARLEKMPEKPHEELLVAIAGPLVNVAIAGALFTILVALRVRPHWGGLRAMGGDFVQQIMVLNLLLVGFNLLPAFPMDGGRVLRALLAMRLEYTRATKLAARVGQGMAVIFALAAIYLRDVWLFFIAMFVWMGAGAEATATAAHASLSGIPVNQVMLTNFRTLGPDDTLEHAAANAFGGWQQDFPVVFGDRVLGVLTREGLSRGLTEKGPQAHVRDAMRRDFPAADPHDLLDHALTLLRACRCRSLPVEQDGRLVGILSADHIARHVMLRRGQQGKNGQSGPTPYP